MDKVKIAVETGDYGLFAREMKNIDVLPFELERMIVQKKMRSFLLHLIEVGKLSQDARRMMGALIKS